MLYSKCDQNKSLYYCDACDKTFGNEKTLYLHQFEHETCGRDGCMYSAHPKLVASHVKMQHDTGLYNRIGKLNTEEDIAKWLEERKRKYPTRKVVEEKKIMEQEKIKRGERINEDKSIFNKSFIKNKDRHRKSTVFQKPARDRKKRFMKKKRLEKQESTALEALKEEESFRGSVPPFGGIRELYDIKEPADDEKHNFTDEEWLTSNESENASESKNVSNALSSLASCYNSDQDFYDVPKNPVNQQDNVYDNDSAPEEVNTVHFKEDESVMVENDSKSRKRGCHSRTRRGSGKRRRMSDCGKENGSVREKPQTRLKTKRDPTLLEKLLSKEIRHERNVILQCVRYVVENNFFLNSDTK